MWFLGFGVWGLGFRGGHTGRMPPCRWAASRWAAGGALGQVHIGSWTYYKARKTAGRVVVRPVAEALHGLLVLDSHFGC